MPHLDCSVVMCSTPTRMTRRSHVGFGSAKSVDAAEARARAAAATLLQCMKDKGKSLAKAYYGHGVRRVGMNGWAISGSEWPTLGGIGIEIKKSA